MSPKSPRQRWMAILARASATEMTSLLAHCPELPEFSVLRGPQSGLIMLRGRAGGAGGPFNLGEMTVTRCTVRAPNGQIGHAYVAGRDPIEAHVVARLERAQAARYEAEAERAAATRVQFFTMATMRS